jgi:hypothetical protein
MEYGKLNLGEAAAMLGLIAMVCMDCKEHYGTVSAQGAKGGVSDGLCDPCEEKRVAAIEKETA